MALSHESARGTMHALRDERGFIQYRFTAAQAPISGSIPFAVCGGVTNQDRTQPQAVAPHMKNRKKC